MIIESFDLIVGAFIMAWGYLMGHGIGRGVGRRAERKKIAQPAKLVCTCKHGYGTHELNKGCQAQVKRANKWTQYYVGSYLHTDESGWQYVPCPCLAYDGPQPPPSYEQLIAPTFTPLPTIEENK